MKQNRISIIGVRISIVNMKTAIDNLFNYFKDARNNYVCVSNVHTTVTAYENNDYKLIQNNSFMSLPDGKPLSVIGKKRGYKQMDRVTGPDFLECIINDERFKDYNHFFYGNTQENLDKFVTAIKNKYPNVRICGSECSKFRDLTKEEKETLKMHIKKNKADFVWVSLGAPKQEKFCADMCKETNACFIGVGGAFNVISGAAPRAPKWMQDLSLEWLYRLIKEPKRLFKRYFVTNSKFIFYLFKEKKR